MAANEVAFANGETWLKETLQYLDGNRQRLGELVRDQLRTVRFRPPEATYLAWLDCRDLGLGDDPAERFRDTGRVALSPGPLFGTAGHGFARFNFATSRAIVAEAVKRMVSAL